MIGDGIKALNGGGGETAMTEMGLGFRIIIIQITFLSPADELRSTLCWWGLCYLFILVLHWLSLVAAVLIKYLTNECHQILFCSLFG